MKQLGFTAGAVLITSLTGCGLLETRERVVGTIASFGTLPQLEVPTEVARGEVFTATIITQGGGCMEQGETEVKLGERQAEITPYDYVITPPTGVYCPLYGQDYEHTATLAFSQKGLATLTFYGRNQTSSASSLTTVTRTLEVR
jgi:hypothetical protein